MILFLNKNDLFQEKIKKVSLRAWDPKYAGAGTFCFLIIQLQCYFFQR